MHRRRFAFWVGICLFWIAERANAACLDWLAAAIMRSTEPGRKPQVRWKPAENRTWQWYQRETLVDGKWVPAGITTPVNKKTGLPYTGQRGYLDRNLVPAEIRFTDLRTLADSEGPTQPDPERRERGGRPPSAWLRSLRAEEIRIWLRTIDVPPVGVSGMTFWTHLTRDHFFDPDNIEGLTVAEQAKLHSAAHFGY